MDLIDSHRNRATFTSMKSAALPSVRIEPALRAELEAVLGKGESLSSFVESSVRRAVEHRQIVRDFGAHCDASLKHFLTTGESYTSEQVLRELRQRTEARRSELLAKAATKAA